MNRVKRIEYYNGTTLAGSVDYDYFDAGARKSMVDSTGTTTYSYDALDRLTSATTPVVTSPGCATHPNCTRTLAYQYDTTGAGGEAPAAYPGERTKITYPDGKVVTYTYKKDGRMWQVKDFLNKTTTYTWNDARFLSGVAYPSPAGSIAYGYDGADRLNSVTHQLLASESFTYVLDAVGNRKQVTKTNETPEVYKYDDLHRLTRVDYPAGEIVNYTYDANGNRKVHDSTFTGTINYQYNGADEVTQVAGSPYASDSNGNLASRGIESYEYDHENRITALKFGGFNPAICYDLVGDSTTGTGNGDVVISEITSFVAPVRRLDKSPGHSGYDPFWDLNPGVNFPFTKQVNISDLTKLFTGSAPSYNRTCPRRYLYNGDGLRASQLLGRGTSTSLEGGRFRTDYLWDTGAGLPVVLQETNREDFYRSTANPSDTAIFKPRTENTYVYGVDLISVTAGTDPQSYVQSYVFPDALGSARTIVNGSDGGATTGYSYDAFGTHQGSGGMPTTFRFAGEQYDYKARKQAGQFGLSSGPGLYYLRARFYDPTLGRFLTPDPLRGSPSDPQSLNRYPYAANNPVNRTDPTGLLSEGPGWQDFDDAFDELTFGCKVAIIGALVGFLFAAPVIPAVTVAQLAYLYAWSISNAASAVSVWHFCLGAGSGGS